MKNRQPIVTMGFFIWTDLRARILLLFMATACFGFSRGRRSAGGRPGKEQQMNEKTGLPMVVHVPHAAVEIPEKWRKKILLDEESLRRELICMTD